MSQNEQNENQNRSDSTGGGSGNQGNPYAQHAHAAAEKAKAAAQDALAAARSLVFNPVGGIGSAFQSLGDQRALGVAVVFGVLAALGLALAGGLLVGAIIGAMMGGMGMGGGFEFGAFIKSFIVYLVTIAGAGVGVWLLSPLFGGKSGMQGGLFVGSTAFLPLGIAALLSAIIAWLLSGRLVAILIGLLMIYGFAYFIQVLNAGLRNVGGVDERRAALATPTVLSFTAVVAWMIGWLLG